MNLRNKHLFIILDDDKFFYLQADALINKVCIKPENLCAIVLKKSEDEDKFDKLNKVEGVEYIKYSENILNDVINAKSLTTISLNVFNSWFVNRLINQDNSVLNKLAIFILDDEVERWQKVFSNKGKLVADKKMRISDHDIEVLSRIKYMIGLKEKFAPIVNRILDRKIHFISVGVIFDILPYKRNELFKKILDLNNETKKRRILVGTKNIPGKTIIDLFKFVRVHPEENVEFIVFTYNLFYTFLLKLISLYSRVIKKRRIFINYYCHSNPLSYLSIVLSCTHVILQDRGGASTARVFSKFGAGILCIKKESPNYYFFNDGHSIDFIKYDTAKGLSKLIMKNIISLKDNKLQLEKLEQEWIKTYREYYN